MKNGCHSGASGSAVDPIVLLCHVPIFFIRVLLCEISLVTLWINDSHIARGVVYDLHVYGFTQRAVLTYKWSRFTVFRTGRARIAAPLYPAIDAESQPQIEHGLYTWITDTPQLMLT